MASTCSAQTSYAQTSASPAFARCAAKRLPTAPHPMTQIFITLELPMPGTLVRSNLRGIRTPQRHSLGCGPVPSLLAGEEFPRHIGKAFAFGLSDSIGVLCVEAHFSVLVDD